MRVVFLAFALLPSAAFGEQCLHFVKQTRLLTLHSQPLSPLLGPLRRATGARHAHNQKCAVSHIMLSL